jgi:hypothetical protein
VIDSKEEGGCEPIIAAAVYSCGVTGVPRGGNFEVVRDEWRGNPVEYYVDSGKEKDARPRWVRRLPYRVFQQYSG